MHIDNRGMNWAHELCGCDCAFDTCAPGCAYGAAIGPGLSPNITADPGTFRFAQGAAALKCIGPAAAPPCLGHPGLEWLNDVLVDQAGGGPCAPAHNIVERNVFVRAAAPFQICGDVKNASRFHHTCTAVADPNPEELKSWGSEARDNTVAPSAPVSSDVAVLWPVRPWPILDSLSPVGFTPWLVNWDIGYYENDTEVQAALAATDPDIFEWDFGSENNRGHTLTRRGVFVSTHQSYEWQQSSGVADAGLIHRQFVSDGLGYADDGKPEQLHPDSANMSDFMSQIAPKWHALTKEGNVRAVRFGQSVTQDNIGNYYGVFHAGGPTLPQGEGFSWGPWINAGFVEFYAARRRTAERFGESSLPALPNGTAGFSLVAYLGGLRRDGLSPLAITRDLILHEYIRYAQNATVGRWADMRAAAQSQATKADRPYPAAVYGNVECLAFNPDACGDQQNRMGIMTIQFVDTILLETTLTIPEFKVALAAGNFEKPIFPYPDTCTDPCIGPTAVGRALGAAPSSSTADAAWYGSHRALLTDRRSVADYAVVLDLPLFFWRGFSSVAVPGNQPHVLAHQNLTALLDTEHVPYDVFLLGHPDFFDDRKQWGALKSYRHLVLPEVEAVSDAHVAQIRTFLEGGGRVVLAGARTGTCDEEDRPRSVPAFSSILGHPGVTTISETIWQDFLQNNSAASRAAVAAALHVADAPLVTAPALPSSAAVAVWEHGEGPMVSVQIALGDSRHNTASAMNISLRCPPGMPPHPEARLYSPSLPAGEPVSLGPARRVGDRFVVAVPSFSGYGAVVVGCPGEAELRSVTASVRKFFERLKLASTVTPGQSPPVALLQSAEALLNRVQGRQAEKLTDGAARDLHPRLNAMASKLSARLAEVSSASVTFNAATRRDATDTSNAVIAIDFGGDDSAPVPSGWRRVTPVTPFGRQPGDAGWIAGSASSGAVHASPAPAALVQGKETVPMVPCPLEQGSVLCTYCFGNSSSPAVLGVGLPGPGNYTVPPLPCSARRPPARVRPHKCVLPGWLVVVETLF